MQMQFTPNTRRASSPASFIRPGDKIRLYDSFYAAYFWHEVTDTITGAHPQIKVHGYESFISASIIAGHQKGGAR